MTSVTAVLFDFGMVLSAAPDSASWETMKQIARLDQQAFHRAYWAPRDDYDRGTLTNDAFWAAVACAADVTFSPSDVRQLSHLDINLWTNLNGPMIEWVKCLHAAGIRTGILSNMGDAMAEGICSKFDWIGNFDHTVWSHALKLRKPEREIYAAAADGLDVPPGEILFIDDRQENIDAAEIFGMEGILYANHADFVTEMHQRGFDYLLNPISVAVAS